MIERKRSSLPKSPGMDPARQFTTNVDTFIHISRYSIGIIKPDPNSYSYMPSMMPSRRLDRCRYYTLGCVIQYHPCCPCCPRNSSPNAIHTNISASYSPTPPIIGISLDPSRPPSPDHDFKHTSIRQTRTIEHSDPPIPGLSRRLSLRT